MRISDWSSDVCSSDLHNHRQGLRFPSACIVRHRRLAQSCAGAAWEEHERRIEAQLAEGIRQSTNGVCVRPYGCLVWTTLPRCNSYRSEEHTSELQSLMRISYAVFCLKKNKTK